MSGWSVQWQLLSPGDKGGSLTVPCCQKMTAVGQPGWEAVRVFFLISGGVLTLSESPSRGRRTVPLEAVLGRLKVAVVGEGVGDARVGGVDERPVVVHRVGKALRSRGSSRRTGQLSGCGIGRPGMGSRVERRGGDSEPRRRRSSHHRSPLRSRGRSVRVGRRETHGPRDDCAGPAGPGSVQARDVVVLGRGTSDGEREGEGERKGTGEQRR